MADGPSPALTTMTGPSPAATTELSAPRESVVNEEAPMPTVIVETVVEPMTVADAPPLMPTTELPAPRESAADEAPEPTTIVEADVAPTAAAGHPASRELSAPAADELTIAFGMDFGTTYSCAAVMEGGEVKTLRWDFNERIIPSTVSVGAGEWQVGRHKITNSCDEDTLVAHGIKRIIGRNSKDGSLESDIQRFRLPFKLRDGEPIFQAGDETMRPEELCACFFYAAKERVEKEEKKKIGPCVITVPAYYTSMQRQRISDSARAAGLPVSRVINEPTAVAVAHLWESGKEEDGDYLVADIGGGTFDISLLNVSSSENNKTIVVEAISGDNALGGDDFTRILADEIGKAMSRVRNSDKQRTRKRNDGSGNESGDNEGSDGDDNGCYQEIMRLCEMAKTNMRRNDKSISITFRGTACRITTAQYRAACEPLIERIRDVIQIAVEKQSEPLKAIILAGGSSYLAMFEDLVRNELPGVEILGRHAAPEVVAEGAAIIAGSDFLIVTEALCRTTGILVNDRAKGLQDIMDPILHRGQPLPASRTLPYVATKHGETVIHIYEGEHTQASKNILRGLFSIAAPPGADINVKISVRADSTIEVTAETGIDSKQLVVKADSGLTEEEIQVIGERVRDRVALGEEVQVSGKGIWKQADLRGQDKAPKTTKKRKSHGNGRGRNTRRRR